MDINIIISITSRAWSLTILKLICEGVPARQASLLSASGASRTSFRNSLFHLTGLGLLERNPGHGHPLRPEYRLTERGQQFGQMACAICATADDAISSSLLRKAWTVPVLAVTGGPCYFGDMKRQLGSVTDRALSHSVRRLQDMNWIERGVETSLWPPRPFYQAVNAGAEICGAVDLAFSNT